jgi:alpha/beta superfamily hydrolase
MAAIAERALKPHEIAPDADSALKPGQRLQWRECLTMLEYAATRLSGDLVDHWPRGDGHPVVVLPGFLAGPLSTSLLRDVLSRLGYRPYDWGLGWNLGYRPNMVGGLAARVEEIQRRSDGQKVSLIGWSAGGIYAREVAREVPEQVRTVISLGSPFRGNHRATHATLLWDLLNRHPEATEIMSEAARIGRAAPLTVPTTCIYSKHDGVVAWECCTSLPAPRTENIEVRSTHFGYGHNLETLHVIADRLAQREGKWRPYQT